jgi:hypothetical protein
MCSVNAFTRFFRKLICCIRNKRWAEVFDFLRLAQKNFLSATKNAVSSIFAVRTRAHSLAQTQKRSCIFVGRDVMCRADRKQDRPTLTTSVTQPLASQRHDVDVRATDVLLNSRTSYCSTGNISMSTSHDFRVGLFVEMARALQTKNPGSSGSSGVSHSSLIISRRSSRRL